MARRDITPPRYAYQSAAAALAMPRRRLCQIMLHYAMLPCLCRTLRYYAVAASRDMMRGFSIIMASIRHAAAHVRCFFAYTMLLSFIILLRHCHDARQRYARRY